MHVTAITPISVDPGTSKNWLFVRIETDAGLVGWGERDTPNPLRTRRVYMGG